MELLETWLWYAKKFLQIRYPNRYSSELPFSTIAQEPACEFRPLSGSSFDPTCTEMNDHDPRRNIGPILRNNSRRFRFLTASIQSSFGWNVMKNDPRLPGLSADR
jgi:hypothetical protein